MLKRNGFTPLFLSMLFLALTFALPILAQENGPPKEAEYYHEISIAQFGKNITALEKYRAAGALNFDLRSEEFRLNEVRALMNISGGARFKINYGAHPDGKVCAMLTIYDSDNKILRVFQRGVPCPPVCGSERNYARAQLPDKKIVYLRK